MINNYMKSFLWELSLISLFLCAVLVVMITPFLTLPIHFVFVYVVLGLLFLFTGIVPHLAFKKHIQSNITDIATHINNLLRCIDGREDCVGNCDRCEHNQTYFTTTKDFDEIAKVLNSYSVDSLRTKNLSKRSEQTLWELAHTDTLTGAGNRYRLHNDWDRIMNSPVKTSRMDICMAIVDANKFKQINDTNGHKAGDNALIAISGTIKETLRAGDSIYRIGGDEFVVMLVDTTMDEAIDVMVRCSYNIKMFDHKSIGVDNPLEVSIGLVNLKGPFDTESLELMLKRADESLYEAKVSSHIHIDKHTDKKLQQVSIPAKSIMI